MTSEPRVGGDREEREDLGEVWTVRIWDGRTVPYLVVSERDDGRWSALRLVDIDAWRPAGAVGWIACRGERIA